LREPFWSKMQPLRRRLARLDHWRRELLVYWRESSRALDFVRVMRVRLSQSKVGRLVTPRPIEVDVDLVTLGPSVRLRSHTTDISVLSELLVGDSYEPLPPDDDVATVFDLGANIGLSCRWLRGRYPGARFVCVEPDRGNLEVLRANVRPFEDVAEVVPACVGGRERRVTLATSDGEWGFRMSDAVTGVEGPNEVGVVTMEHLLSRTGVDHIDVLKCDIEGAEAELFADCRDWIGRVEAMSVECHNDVMPAEALLEALAANGAEFAVRHVERNPGMGFDIITLQRERDGER
jgi:FkbM family methyltransferase